ncbi:hypothetical protein D3C77_128730 [compost metagenome]
MGLAGLIATVQEHLDHGRRQEDFADALLVNGLQHLVWGEGRQYHVGTTAEEQRGHGGVVSQVEHRHDMQEHGGRAITAGVQGRHCRKGDIAVAEHHALGEAGGATGIENTQ